MCDRILTGGLLFLILFTPLAFGSVHPWAFSLMEGVVFLLVVVWMVKAVSESQRQEPKSESRGGEETPRPGDLATWKLGDNRRISSVQRPGIVVPPDLRLFLPLIFFVSFLLFQLLPLPPSLLHILSPATYTFYTKALPGWPEKTPYDSLFSLQDTKAEVDSTPWVVLPTPEEMQQGALASRAEENGEDARIQRQEDTEISARPVSTSFAAAWRPLSIAPSLSRTDLLKFLAYAGLFFLVLCSPFGSSARDEKRFLRRVLVTVLGAGLLIASIGVVQRFSWTGKILGFFVPYDWGKPYVGLVPRASGPFINADHFANYLALILPLAFAGVVSPGFFVSEEKRRAFRLFCGCTAFLVFTGIMLSLSRGGWIGVVIGTGVLLMVLLSQRLEERPSLLRRSQKSVVRFAVAGMALLVALAVFFVGPGGRSQVDVRLEQTVKWEENLRERTVIWQDTLGMTQDFPFFGVGLGAWPDLFPRYQRPPWSPFFIREAHNDYLELLAETGVVGFGLLAWFFWQAGRRLARACTVLSSKLAPVYAALIAALASMAFHEFFDFNLQIPANAFLFTIFLAISLRLAQDTKTRRHADTQTYPATSPRRVITAATGTGAVAVVLLLLALRQQGLPYPHNLHKPVSLAEAQERLVDHPARSSSHLSLLSFLPTEETWSRRSMVVEAALWLDPRNPYARDLYAQALLQQGRKKEALQEVTAAVFLSPAFSTHRYLNGRIIPWLSAEEQEAIEKGYRQAVAAFGSHEAVLGLGAFYTALARFSEEGMLYERMAAEEKETEIRILYLLRAGLAYVRAGEGEQAETVLRQATMIAPQDPRPYQYLVTRVFALRGELAPAKAVIAEGIERGADPFSLYFSLGDAAQAAKNKEEAEAAFLQALTFQPASFNGHFRLGLLYLQEGNVDRAALSLRKATELDPASAVAFSYLGIAEEKRYQLLAAQDAYARSVKMAPENVSFQKRYQEFLQRVAEDQQKN